MGLRGNSYSCFSKPCAKKIGYFTIKSITVCDDCDILYAMTATELGFFAKALMFFSVLQSPPFTPAEFCCKIKQNPFCER